MRIDRLEISNFKCWEKVTLELHPHFTLFAGVNGVGKTSLLDALSIAMGVWLESPPDSTVRNSRRNFLDSEIHLKASREGDRLQFRQITPAVVTAIGTIAEENDIKWTRRSDCHRGSARLSMKRAMEIVEEVYRRDSHGEKVICPIIAYYGAGRAWLPSNRRVKRRTKANGSARRWWAFYDWCNERIRFDDLKRWFQRETTEMGNRQGRPRPGFQAVRNAILSCVPNAEHVWFDTDLDDIVLSINSQPQSFENLSAGQRMMLGLVADIAIKCVTQNAWLLPNDDFSHNEGTLPKVLLETPGIVLIDELDVHLHPIWQRRVASDLKRNFPAIQFVATSHSPQIIGELQPEEIRLITVDGQISTPSQSFGLDSNEVLQSLQGAEVRNSEVERDYETLFDLISKRSIVSAQTKLRVLQERLGKTSPLQRAAASIERINLLGS